MGEQIKHIRTAVHSQPNSLKCKLPNRISFNVFDRCFCKVETRACETQRSCANRLGGLTVTILLGASRSFNPGLLPARTHAKRKNVSFLSTYIFLFYCARLLFPFNFCFPICSVAAISCFKDAVNQLL